ncbi:MAG TPA: hypothetical protein PLQ44_00515 [Candidatus Paceibacterota bacterium]|nr:hypothetical protein [Candidatus Paceibacterota bacterium]HPT40076.1 hypothetical protein [Candidatus Paceibacterota bacterium]
MEKPILYYFTQYQLLICCALLIFLVVLILKVIFRTKKVVKQENYDGKTIIHIERVPIYEIAEYNLPSFKFISWVRRRHPDFNFLVGGSGKIISFEKHRNNFIAVLYEGMNTECFYDKTLNQDISKKIITKKLFIYIWENGEVFQYSPVDVQEISFSLKDVFTSDILKISEKPAKKVAFKILKVFKISDCSVGVSVCIDDHERTFRFSVA